MVWGFAWLTIQLFKLTWFMLWFPFKICMLIMWELTKMMLSMFVIVFIKIPAALMGLSK